MLPPRRRAPQRSSKRKKETTLLKYQKNKTRKEKNERIPVQSQEEAVQNENGCVEEVEDETTRIFFRCCSCEHLLTCGRPCWCGTRQTAGTSRPKRHIDWGDVVSSCEVGNPLRPPTDLSRNYRPKSRAVQSSTALPRTLVLQVDPERSRAQAGLSSRAAYLPASSGFTPPSWSSATAGLSSKFDWQTSRVLAS